jgi:hypothetical protein
MYYDLYFTRQFIKNFYPHIKYPTVKNWYGRRWLVKIYDVSSINIMNVRINCAVISIISHKH